MERRLIVMRHAKSSWKSDAGSDHERPLNKRGRRDAPLVAQRLVDLGWAPDAVWASDSKRTRETWKCMTKVLDGDIDVEFTRELYHGTLYDILDSASDWPPALETVLVLFHNPGCEMAVHALSGELHPMTTANAALLVGSGRTWREALETPWRLETVVRPRELAD